MAFLTGGIWKKEDFFLVDFAFSLANTAFQTEIIHMD